MEMAITSKTLDHSNYSADLRESDAVDKLKTYLDTESKSLNALNQTLKDYFTPPAPPQQPQHKDTRILLRPNPMVDVVRETKRSASAMEEANRLAKQSTELLAKQLDETFHTNKLLEEQNLRLRKESRRRLWIAIIG
jgi:hypothetical protein